MRIGNMKVFIISLFLAICICNWTGVAGQTHLGDRFLLNISTINAHIHVIHRDFEQNKIHNDKAKFHLLIDEIKVQKQALSDIRVDVNGILSSLVSYNVLDKVYLEFSRIMTESYSDALDLIAFEILGHQAGISEFKPTYVSEPLNLATGLLKGKFDVIINELADVDHRMNTIMNHKNTTVDLINELRVLSELSKAVEDALKLKAKLYEVYTSEGERVMLEGKQLNILQKNEVELHILMIDWLVQFVRTYQELIRKLVGTNY